ncbi:MAG: TetR/AcrR family transcriptional regulator [Candidatus Binataceae bacterium]
MVFGRPRIPMLREKILRSAIGLFAEKGFDRVLIDEIATHAGVGKGSVYRQFSSKEELYTVAVIEGYIDLRTRIAAALENAKSMPEAVTTIVRQIVSYFWDRLDFFELLRNPTKLPRTYENRYRSERQKLARIISTVLAQGATSGVIRDDLDPQLLVESLLGMIRGIQRSRRGAVALSQEEVVRAVVSVFLYGCSRHPPVS